MTYTVQADPTGMECTITSTDAKHGFELVTTYITDPQRDTVLMNTRIEPTKGSAANIGALQIYARLDAHVNGDGGGGTQNAGGNTGVIDARTGIPVVYSTNTTTEAANRTLRGADLHGDDRHLGRAKPRSATRAPRATG